MTERAVVNALRLLDERPGARRVYTGNADSNAAMLAINAAMGFRPVRRMGMWQLPLEGALP